MSKGTNPAKVAVTVSVTPTPALDTGAAIVEFHHWIQGSSVPGMLLDVADYSHVERGPGVLLVAHEGEYGLRFGQGEASFTFRRRRDGDAALEASLRDAAVRVLEGCKLLVRAGLIESEVAASCELSCLDRLSASVQPLSGAAPAVLDTLYGKGAYERTKLAADPDAPPCMAFGGKADTADAFLARLAS